MPSRSWVLVIIVFWLITSAWLYQRDLWPRLRTDEPAPFAFDLADEARIEMTDRPPRSPLGSIYVDSLPLKGQTRPVRWSVHRDGQELGDYAETRVVYRRRDHTLDLLGEFKLFATDRREGRDPIVRIESTYHVNWNGELLDVTGDIWVRTPSQDDQVKIAQLTGPIRNGQLAPTWWITTANKEDVSPQEPVTLSRRGGVLISTQPLNRIIGLQVGQRWQIPMLDLLAVVGPRQPAPFVSLEAEVGEDLLDWLPRRKPVPCWVVTYRREDRPCVRTWVQQSDGLVLRHEFLGPGERLLFKRDQ